MEYLEDVLRDLNNHPPEFASQLYLQSATQNKDQVSYRVVKNLQQDTTYEFKISAVNEKGGTDPVSKMLTVRTESSTASRVIDTAIEILKHFVNNYPKSPSRIVQIAWEILSTKGRLPPPVQTPSSESELDSDNDQDESNM